MNHKKHIDEWMDKIKKPQKILNNFSICPFSHKAKKIEIEEINEGQEINIVSLDCDVKFFVLNYELSEDQLEQLCIDLNKKYSQFVFLPDHKDSSFDISGIKSGNGKINIILCQMRKELDKHRYILKKTDYYKFWSKENLKKIFSF